MADYPNGIPEPTAGEKGIYVSTSIKSGGVDSTATSSVGSNVDNAMNEYLEHYNMDGISREQPPRQEVVPVSDDGEAEAEDSCGTSSGRSKKHFWSFHLYKGRKKVKSPSRLMGCFEFSFRGKPKQHGLGFAGHLDPETFPPSPRGDIPLPMIDFTKFNPENYPIDDFDERARVERAREIAEGVDPPVSFSPPPTARVTMSGRSGSVAYTPSFASSDSPLTARRLQWMDLVVPDSTVVHTQVDYIHCLIPDLLAITNSCYYWGKIDRYEAEKLLDSKAEGTFLLRDSAQDGYQFSVSFRRYGRSLHARIEQFKHKFSFDSHDPGVFAASTVTDLIEHYKDPKCCMFFEPMLTIPLKRNFAFSLQHLCRAVISSCTSYDGINILRLPKPLKSYLREYHYEQKVRVKWLHED